MKKLDAATRRGVRRAGRPAPKPSVLLIAMPWHYIRTPSIQLGTLQAVLERARIHTEAATLALAFLEHCLAATASWSDEERFTLADYDAIASGHADAGLGDWIFAVPPFRDPTPEGDAGYLAALRTAGAPEPLIAKAVALRGLVPGFLEAAAGGVLATGARVVGFTSTFNQNVPSLALARLLKQRDPSIAVIFGGANCEGPMGAALHRLCPWVDVVVRGEAEAILPGLVRDLLAGGPVRPRPGLCYREDGRSVAVPAAGAGAVRMDDVPLPRFDEYFERLAATSFATDIAADVEIVYESARGCWWGVKSHCTFCGLNGESMAFRSKSPDRVVADLAALARRHGRLDFQVVDNILDLRYFQEVLPRLRDAGHNLRLFYEVKANLTRAQVRLLREAGVSRIQPGLESLSTPILRHMRKGVTAFQNVRLLKWCAEYGVRVTWNVIYGFPGEPPGEYARMADLALSLTHLQPPNLSPLSLERFSPYHARPHDFGLEILGPCPWYPFVYDSDAATLMDLAYMFEYRHLDGRDPSEYVQPLRRALEAWHAHWPRTYRTLRYRRGPGFLVICDRRPSLEHADYTLGENEARIYLACEDGATAAAALARLREAGTTDFEVDDVRAFLDELRGLRLVFEEDGRYLALALPAELPEPA